jgi:hypothetical protein
VDCGRVDAGVVAARLPRPIGRGGDGTAGCLDAVLDIVEWMLPLRSAVPDDGGELGQQLPDWGWGWKERSGEG